MHEKLAKSLMHFDVATEIYASLDYCGKIIHLKTQ